MKIETIKVDGFEPAIKAMRNPMDSWSKSDSTTVDMESRIGDEIKSFEKFIVGKNDRELSLKLQKAGPEHCKHLRMIMVWADIISPRYWWTEMSTYRAGVETVSCSTMHKLMARPLTLEDFEYDTDAMEIPMKNVIYSLNSRMENYKVLKADGCELEAKEIWREIIQLLPQSYLQKRTVMISYAALRNIVHQRQGHKLKEWAQFITWAKTLPNSWMIFDE